MSAGMSKDTYDSPWKGILERYFPEFVAYFFPEIHQEIDWSRGYESLDKELEQVTRDAALGKRYADKLIKVWRRNGEEQVVHIHVEVQGQPEAAFPQRMHVYHYRIFDRYQKPVVSLAILTDDRPSWRPDRFGYELWGCRASLTFPIAKLSDYNERWDELESRSNLFATVVMAHLKTQATRKDPDARFRWKMAICRRLYESGFERQQILDLFRFVDWVMWLPPELKEQFKTSLKDYEAEKKMEYVTTFERSGIKKGEATVLKRLLGQRFNGLPGWAEERLDGATREQLESWADRVLDATRLEDVFASE